MGREESGAHVGDLFGVSFIWGPFRPLFGSMLVCLFWALGTSFGCRFSFFVFFLGGGSWLTGSSKCKAQRRLSANGEESKGDRFLFDATA